MIRINDTSMIDVLITFAPRVFGAKSQGVKIVYPLGTYPIFYHDRPIPHLTSQYDPHLITMISIVHVTLRLQKSITSLYRFRLPLCIISYRFQFPLCTAFNYRFGPPYYLSVLIPLAPNWFSLTVGVR